MSSNLLVSLVPANQQITVNLSWSGATPQGTIDYIVFYRPVGSNQIKSKSSTSLQIVLTNLVNDTQYSIQATAFRGGYQNGQALSESEVQLSIPATVSEAPANLVAVVSTNVNLISQEVDLSWDASITDVNYPILNYNIYQSLDNVNFTLIQQTSDLFVQVLGLDNGTLYYFNVSAVNGIGESLMSNVSATPLNVPSLPQNLLVNFDPDASVQNQEGYHSIDLSWAASDDNGGSAIVNYTIQYSLDPSFLVNVFSVVTPDATASESIQNTNLITPFADRQTSTGWYYFRVRANNSLGSGSFTSVTTIMPASAPLTVTNLSSSNLDADGNHAMGTISLQFDYAVDDACPLLGYIVAFIDESGVLDTRYVNDTSLAPEITIDGLQNGFEYNFNVMAFNMLNSGESVDIQQIPSYMPDAPSNLAIEHGDTQLIVSWDAPDDQGNDITSYNIYRDVNGTGYSLLTNVNALTYTNTGLTNGTVYSYKISAINNDGEGALSDPANEYPSTTPLPPLDTQLYCINSNASSSGQQVTIHWTQDPVNLARNGGSVLSSFVVYNQNGVLLGTVLAVVGQSDYSLVLNNLINGLEYTFVIRSINRDGQSSGQVTRCTPSGLPDGPVVDSVVNNNADDNGQELTISYELLNVATGGANLHPSDEGSLITEYNIYRDGVYLDDVDADVTTYLDTNLVNGQSHSYTVYGVNINGLGAISNAISAIPSCKPDQITSLDAEHGNHSANLSWDLLNVATGGVNVSPSDEGSVILSYKIYQSTDNITYTLVSTKLATATSALIIGLINGDTYYFKISGTNANGESALSSSVSVVPSDSPQSVRSVNIIPSDSQLAISWEKPRDDLSGHLSGGLAYVYNVQVTDSNENLVFQNASLGVTFVTVNNLVDNGVYNVAIYADNGVDTNYNIYNVEANVVPAPLPVTNLAWNSSDETQISITFNYETLVYGVTEFLLVAFDKTTLLASCSVGIDPTDQASIDGDTYYYEFHLNAINAFQPLLQTSDEMVVAMFVQNQYGLSDISNFVSVN